MIRIGQKALKANGLSFLLFGFYTVYSSLFLALGKAGEGFVLGACRQGICFVPIILVFPALWGLNGILYAQPAADVLSAVTALFMAVHLNRDIGKKGKGILGWTWYKMNSGIRRWVREDRIMYPWKGEEPAQWGSCRLGMKKLYIVLIRMFYLSMTKVYSSDMSKVWAAS